MSAAKDSETIANPSVSSQAPLRRHSVNRWSPRTVRSTSTVPPRGPVEWGFRSLRIDAQQHHEPAMPRPDSDSAELAPTCDSTRRTSPTRPSQCQKFSIPRSHKPTRNTPDRANQARGNDRCRELVGTRGCTRLGHSDDRGPRCQNLLGQSPLQAIRERHDATCSLRELRLNPAATSRITFTGECIPTLLVAPRTNLGTLAIYLVENRQARNWIPIPS